jgi:hypothetical protein
MARQRRALRARRAAERESSVFLRSAESLGRVIGLLQRQLDNVSRRTASASPETSTPPRRKNGDARAPKNGAPSEPKAKRSLTAKATPAARVKAAANGSRKAKTNANGATGRKQGNGRVRPK